MSLRRPLSMTVMRVESVAGGSTPSDRPTPRGQPLTTVDDNTEVPCRADNADGGCHDLTLINEYWIGFDWIELAAPARLREALNVNSTRSNRWVR